MTPNELRSAAPKIADGYYWVQDRVSPTGLCLIAKWETDSWYLCGNARGFGTDVFAAVFGPIDQPGQRP